MTVQPLTHPRLGVAYYPEHWAESRWAEDAKLLREAGITVARMMEFAWDKLEPREGKYDFGWMDKALQIFGDAGISVVLCTPTATPPPWLFQKYPDIFNVHPDTGVKHGAGSRRTVSANAPDYLTMCDRIVTAIADQWGQHPHVIGWQIDNEFGCHSTIRDLSDHSLRAFQAWLKAKYETLDALNAAWGTQFWSTTYSDWTQIPVPKPTASYHNPGLLLDFRRFSSASWVAFQKRQIDILRPRIGTERFITHNMMLKFMDMDYFDLARDLDFVGYDNYLHGMSGPMEAAFNFDLMRGMKGGRPFWIMEQQPGPVNWTPFNPPVPPGQVRAWTHQALGHGAEAVLYFRERAVNIGQEQYHAGVLKHDGSPDRCWYESKAVSEDLIKLPVLKRPQSPVALVFDYEDAWVLELDPHNREFSYYRLVLDIYNQLWSAQIPVDVVARSADLSGYQTVIIPAPALIRESEAAHWHQYVEAGGNLILTFRSFFKNLGSTWTDQPMPAGGLGELLGVQVDEFLSIPPVKSVGWRTSDNPYPDWDDDRGSHVTDIEAKLPGFGFGESFGVPPKARYGVWAEVLKPTTATPIMRYTDGYYKDSPAATANKVGKGMAYYLGCWCEQPIPKSVWKATGLAALAIPERDLPRGAVMEIIKMVDEAGSPVEIRINHSKRTVSLPESVAP